MSIELDGNQVQTLLRSRLCRGWQLTFLEPFGLQIFDHQKQIVPLWRSRPMEASISLTQSTVITRLCWPDWLLRSTSLLLETCDFLRAFCIFTELMIANDMAERWGHKNHVLSQWINCFTFWLWDHFWLKMGDCEFLPDLSRIEEPIYLLNKKVELSLVCVYTINPRSRQDPIKGCQLSSGNWPLNFLIIYINGGKIFVGKAFLPIPALNSLFFNVILRGSRPRFLVENLWGLSSLQRNFPLFFYYFLINIFLKDFFNIIA